MSISTRGVPVSESRCGCTHCDGVKGLHARLVEAGTPILNGPAEGLFGLAPTFADPDGHAVTVHDRG